MATFAIWPPGSNDLVAFGWQQWLALEVHPRSPIPPATSAQFTSQILMKRQMTALSCSSLPTSTPNLARCSKNASLVTSSCHRSWPLPTVTLRCSGQNNSKMRALVGSGSATNLRIAALCTLFTYTPPNLSSMSASGGTNRRGDSTNMQSPGWNGLNANKPICSFPSRVTFCEHTGATHASLRPCSQMLPGPARKAEPGLLFAKITGQPQRSALNASALPRIACPPFSSGSTCTSTSDTGGRMPLSTNNLSPPTALGEDDPSGITPHVVCLRAATISTSLPSKPFTSRKRMRGILRKLPGVLPARNL
mmetsp:Transcript_55124/g.148653  ORF Transcript_55124/g.148653 Transcript_55124/m.148653 type:complete len:307 (-) Transcript_55124:23-943(-)